MANFAQPIHNPIDDPTTDELLEACLVSGLIDEDQTEDFEHWELEQILAEARAEDHAANFYSY